MSDLQRELESLRVENARLRKLLKLTEAEAAPALGTQTAWFDKAPGSVDARSASQEKVEFYAALFGARRGVYAVRSQSACSKTVRSGGGTTRSARCGQLRRKRTPRRVPEDRPSVRGVMFRRDLRARVAGSESLRHRAAHAGPIDDDTLVRRVQFHIV